MRALAIFVGFALATPAFAEAKPDPTTLAAARELMRVSDLQGQMRAFYPAVAGAIGDQMRQLFVDNKVPDGLGRELTAAIQANIGSLDSLFTPELVDKMANIYAGHFTAEELKRLSAMMNDPVMGKFRAESPHIMGELMPLIFEAIKPRQQDFEKRLRQIVTDWIKQHPEDKAKLRSPTAS